MKRPKKAPKDTEREAKSDDIENEDDVEEIVVAEEEEEEDEGNNSCIFFTDTVSQETGENHDENTK